MGEGTCKYAIPMKPPYQYPFACAVMYECRWDGGGRNMWKSCPRFQIGDNMERNGQKLRGKTVMQRYDEIKKSVGSPCGEREILKTCEKYKADEDKRKMPWGQRGMGGSLATRGVMTGSKEWMEDE